MKALKLAKTNKPIDKKSLGFLARSWSQSKLEDDVDNNEDLYVYITGTSADLMVLDFDDDESYYTYIKILGYTPNTRIVKTAKGYHVYFKHSSLFKNNKSKQSINMDLLVDNCLCYSHPSICKKLPQYRIITEYKQDGSDITAMNEHEIQVLSEILQIVQDKDTTLAKNHIIKYDKRLYELVSMVIMQKRATESLILEEFNRYRPLPMQLTRIPREEGEGRNNFLSVFRGKCCASIYINAESAEKFLRILNDSFLNLPEREMVYFSERYIASRPNYVDPVDFIDEKGNILFDSGFEPNLNKEFFAIDTNAFKNSAIYYHVQITDYGAIRLRPILNKSLLSVNIEVTALAGYYLNEKGKVMENKLTKVLLKSELNSRIPIRKSEDKNLYIINTSCIGLSKAFLEAGEDIKILNDDYTDCPYIKKLLLHIMPDPIIRDKFLGDFAFFIRTLENIETYATFIDKTGGTGKSIFFNILRRCIYDDESVSICEVIADELIDNKFNEMFIKSKLLISNESIYMNKTRSRMLTERLKSMVANSMCTSEGKGKPQELVKSCRFLLTCTNHISEAFVAEGSERRQYFIEPTQKPLNKEHWFVELVNKTNSIYDVLYAEIPAFMRWILETYRDYTQEDYRKAPESSLKSDIKNLNKTQFQIDIEGIFKQNGIDEEEVINRIMDYKQETSESLELLQYIKENILSTGIITNEFIKTIQKVYYPTYTVGRPPEDVYYFRRMLNTNYEIINEKVLPKYHKWKINVVSKEIL